MGADGYVRPITLAVVDKIRAANIKVWRTGDTVWVQYSDVDRVGRLDINPDSEEFAHLR